MTTLYTPQGKAVEVPENEVAGRLQSGELRALAGQEVQIVNPETGGAGTVAAEELGQLPAGWRPETAGEADVRTAKAEYGGLGSSLRAAAEAGLGSATFGLYDVAAAGIGGDEYRESRRRRELANPVSTGAGEIGSIIAPLAATALTGGAAAPTLVGRVARFASLPTRAALGAGELAATGTRLGTRALLGESTLARAVSRLGAGAAGGAVEGAAYGAGSALSDAALEKDGYDHLAEKLIAGAREGAVFGGGAGAVLAGVGGVAKSGVERLTGSVGVRGKAAEAAENLAIRAMDPSKRAAREIAGREREIGRELLKRGIVADDVARNSTEEMLERASREFAKTGDEIGQTMKRLDDAGLMVDAKSSKLLASKIDDMIAKRTGERVTFGLSPGTGNRRVVSQSATSELRAPAEKAVGQRLDTELRPLVEKARAGTLTHEELHRFRRSVDGLVDWSKLTDKGLSQDLKGARNVLEDAIESSVATNGKLLGDDAMLASYQAAKKGYAASRFAQKQLTDNLARGQANRWWSLTDTIAQYGGLAGTIATGNIGTGMVMGLLAGAGNKLLREKGAGVLSVLANRVATADTKIARSVGRFVRGVRIAPVAIGAGTKGPVDLALAKRKDESRDRAYERTVEALHRPVAPEMIGGLARTAPNVAAATVARLETGRQYLLKHLPTPPRDPNALIPMKPPPPDPVALASFTRRKQIVDRPLSILEELEAHTVTNEHVDALKNVYPKIYQQVRTHVTETIIDSRKTPTYEQRIQIGTLFQLPTDPTLKPAAIQSFQAMYQKQREQAAAAKGPKVTGGGVVTAKAFETQSQQLEAFGLDA